MGTMAKRFDTRKNRWLDLMDPEGENQVLHTVTFADDPDIPARPWPNPDNAAVRQEWALRKYQTMTERAEWLHDDALPYLDLFTGTEIFAEAFGCPVQYPSNNMPFALPKVFDASEAARLKVPALESTRLYDLIEQAEQLRDRAGGDALIRLPDLQTPMDVAALIWEKADFYIAMMEEPDAVLELAGKTGSLITAFLDAWFDRLGDEYIAHYPDYYMKGGITVSEDEIGAVSPAIFDSLFLPELVALSSRYGGMGLHCCAHARHQWPGLAKIPGLRLLNLIQPEETLKDAFAFFAGTCVQLHNWSGGMPPYTDADALTDQVRVVLTPVATSPEEAVEISEKLGQCRTFSDIIRAGG